MVDFINQSILTTPDKLGYIAFKLKPIFSNFLIAVIILFIGLIIGKIAGRVLEKVLQELKFNAYVKYLISVDMDIDSFLGKLTQYIIFFIAIVFALDTLGLSSFMTYIFSGIVLLIILGSFLVSSKNFLPNLISGIMIYRKKLIRINDIIKVDATEGKVIEFNLFETKIKTSQEDIILIPNSFITKKIVTVYKRK